VLCNAIPLTLVCNAIPPDIFPNTSIFCLSLLLFLSFFSSFSSLSYSFPSPDCDLISSCHFEAVSPNLLHSCHSLRTISQSERNKKKKIFVDSRLCTNYCKVCVVDYIHFVRFVIIKVFLLWFPVTCWDKPERALQPLIEGKALRDHNY